MLETLDACLCLHTYICHSFKYECVHGVEFTNLYLCTLGKALKLKFQDEVHLWPCKAKNMLRAMLIFREMFFYL